MSRYHIRRCHMLPQSTIVSKNCWWNNPFLVRTNSGNSQRETTYSILRSVSKARNRAKVYQKKDKTVTMAPLGFLEWRCEGRLNQGFPSGLYLSRFTIYKTPPSLNSPGFSQVGCSWRFGPLRKTLSRQSFCELFSHFRKSTSYNLHMWRLQSFVGKCHHWYIAPPACQITGLNETNVWSRWWGSTLGSLLGIEKVAWISLLDGHWILVIY